METIPTPFIIQGLQIFAPVHVNGQKTFAHLLTGSNINYIFSDLAKKLEFNGSNNRDYTFGKAESQVGQLSNIELLGQTYDDLEVEYLSNWDKLVQEKYPLSVDLSLGASVLFSQPLILDFLTQKIAFCEDKLPNWFEISCNFIKSIPILNINLGDYKIKAIIHTGFGISVLNQTHPLASVLQNLAKVAVNDSATGLQQQIDVFVGSEIRAADVSLGQFEGLMQDLSSFEERFDTKIDMVLGMNTLISSGKVWLIDAQRQKVMIAPPSERFNWTNK